MAALLFAALVLVLFMGWGYITVDAVQDARRYMHMRKAGHREDK